MYECVDNCGGWADRIKGIFTTYALSILTDRKLLVKIEKPCKFENAISPNEIDWRIDPSLNRQMTVYYYFIHWDYAYLKKHFFTVDFTNFQPEFDLIVIRTGLELLRHLTVNPNHHAKIRQAGYEVDKFNFETLLETWFKKLFKYNDYLESRYNELLKLARPTKHTKLVCAQVRIGGGKDFNFLSLNNTKNYWSFIREKFLTNLNDYKLFVTSDSKQVIDEAYGEFGEEHLLGFKNHSTHIDMVNSTKNDDQCKQISELYLDFRMLSQCHMGVVSQSNFGIFGIMNRKEKDYEKNFYIYSNIDNMSKQFWNRNDLVFLPFNATYIYLEDMNHFQSILKF